MKKANIVYICLAIASAAILLIIVVFVPGTSQLGPGTATVNVRLFTFETYGNPTYYYRLYINGNLTADGSFYGGSPADETIQVSFPIQQSGFYQAEIFVDLWGGSQWTHDLSETITLTDGESYNVQFLAG